MTTQRICLLFQLLCCSTGSYDPLSMSVFTEFNSRSQLVSICGKKKSKQRASEVLVVNIVVHSEAFLTDIHSKVEPVAS